MSVASRSTQPVRGPDTAPRGESPAEPWRVNLNDPAVWDELCQARQVGRPYPKGGPFNPFGAPPEPIMTLRRRVLAPRERAAYTSGRRSVEGLRLPDFLGIGVQKAGTTWLWENLNRHPTIALAYPKELHYFSLHNWAPLSMYSEAMRRALEKKPDTARLVGEVTPVYSGMPMDWIRYLKKIMPGCKPIMLLRDPIDRVWSAARMFLASSLKRSIEDVPQAQLMQFIRSNASLARTDYVSMLENWRSAYPGLFVGSFEVLTARPAAMLRDLFAYLEVDDRSTEIAGTASKAVFAGLNGEMPPRVAAELERIYAPMIERMAREEPAIAGPWLEALETRRRA